MITQSGSCTDFRHSCCCVQIQCSLFAFFCYFTVIQPFPPSLPEVIQKHIACQWWNTKWMMAGFHMSTSSPSEITTSGSGMRTKDRAVMGPKYHPSYKVQLLPGLPQGKVKGKCLRQGEQPISPAVSPVMADHWRVEGRKSVTAMSFL